MFKILIPILLCLAPSAAALQNGPTIQCTPQGYSVDGGDFVTTGHPIAQGLSHALPGSVVNVEPGDYPTFTIGFGRGPENADVSGTELAPITIRAAFPGPKPRIMANGGAEALRVTQNKKAAYITFEGLEFVPGYRSAIIFYRQNGSGVHRGFRFVDCDILGGWDHINATGNRAKWGVSGHRLADFEWIGLTQPSRIQDIREEHAFYLQNCAGDVTLENIEAKRLGRTFCQFTARAGDGPSGVGNITVRNCRVSDTGLAAGDNYKGGSAFTVSGNMPKAKFLFEGNTYRAGFDPALLKLTRKGVVYGTGAFVVWAEGEHKRVGSVVLKNNDFRYAPGTGDRPVVAFSAAKDVRLEGLNRFEAGAYGVALSFDPPRSGGVPAPLPLIKAKVATTTVMKGRLEVKGHLADGSDRKRLGLAPK